MSIPFWHEKMSLCPANGFSFRGVGDCTCPKPLFSSDRSSDTWWPGNPTTATPAALTFPADDLGRPVEP